MQFSANLPFIIAIPSTKLMKKSSKFFLYLIGNNLKEKLNIFIALLLLCTAKKRNERNKRKMKNIEVVWENEEALVINKPAGMVVNRAESVKGETIQDWVEKQDWWKKENSDEVFNNRSGIQYNKSS